MRSNRSHHPDVLPDNLVEQRAECEARDLGLAGDLASAAVAAAGGNPALATLAARAAGAVVRAVRRRKAKPKPKAKARKAR